MLGQLPLHASNDLTLSVSLSSSFATCDVSNDASVTASTSGGNPPYSYEWSVPNGGSDPWKLEGVGAGFYTVTVTDDDGQTTTATEEVELSPEGIWVMLSVEAEVSCAGGDNGVVHAGPMTGVEPYSYEWSDGQTTQDAYGLPAGNICVTVTDANGCSGVECIDVENGDSDLSVSLSSSFATCDVSTDASVTASTSGGNSPYTYEWSVPNGGSDPWKLEGVGAGTYSVTVTDSDGCSVVATEEVELSPEGIWIMVNIEQNISCFGGSDAVVHAGAMTGEAPYTYEWSNGETGEDAFNVSAGNICVTVTDSNGCSGVECIDVDEPDGMDIEISSNDAACGSSNGSASVEVTGGASPYEYIWSNGGTSNEIDNISGGTYSVIVTDANDCTLVQSVDVGDSNALSISVTSTAALCGDDNGTATADASGGSGNYSYDWGFATGSTISNLSGGTYIVTVTDNVSACTGTASIEVEESSSINLAINSNMATCDANDGSATVTASGGLTPYSYAWSSGGTESTELDLGPGSYTVTVTDDAGCTAETAVNVAIQLDCCDDPTIVSVVIFETPCGVEEGSVTISIAENPADYNIVWSTPAGVGLSASNLAAGTYSVVITDASDADCNNTLTFTIDTDNGPEVNITSTPATCTANDGTATITPVDPGSTYEYQWSTNDTGSSLTSLAAGEYQVTIIDPANLDCPGYQTVIVEEENSFVASVNVVQPDCGEANGSATITTNGTGPFTYSWAGGQNTLSNIPSGTYTVLVTDMSTGCTDELTFSLNDNVDPVEIIIDPTDALVSCPGQNDGEVMYTVSPLVPTIIVDATTGVEQTNGSLAPGSYCIQAVNADGCLSGSACFEVSEPAQLDVDINTSDVSCLGMGSIGLVNITGGIPPYTVDWSPSGIDLANLDAGDYSFTLTDANDCAISETITINTDATALTITLNTSDADCSGDNGAIAIMDIVGGTAPYDTLWSTGSSAAELTDLLPGNYSVTITDATGCIGTADTIINDKQPPVITSVVVIETECLVNEGVATISLSEDESNYEWTWSGAVSTSNQATGLAVGTYDITIVDPSDPSCVIYETFTVGSVNGPEAQLITSPANCTAADGVAFFNPPAYTYEWSDGPIGSGRNDLSAGEYQVTIYDSADPDCIDVVTVVIDDENPLELTYDVQQPDCGVANGAATITVASGGSGGPYEYVWNNSGAAIASTQNGLASGAYSVTVTDPATGCSKDISFVVNDGGGNASVVITSTEVMVSCPGAQNGEVMFDVSPAGLTAVIQGTDGMVYTNGNLGPGTYCITVTDAAGCMSGSDCFEVVEPDQIDVDVAAYDVACDEMGAITLLNIVGGTGDYNVTWAAPVVSSDTILTNLEAADYSFTLTDANGCVVGAAITIDDSSVELEVDILLDASLLCAGDSTGTISALATGGNPEYVYDWGTMGIGDTLIDIPAGSYTVTATDENGCTGVDSILISEPDPVFVQLQNDTIACDDVINLVVLTGSTTSITWYDKAGDIVGTGNPLEVMVEDTACYYVEVIDLNGCPAKDSILVIDGGDLLPEFTWNFDQCGDSAIVSFIDLSTVSVGDIVEWEWIINGTVYNEENPVVVFTESGNVEVILTVTSATNCMGTVETTFPLLVAPQPPILDSLNICPGGSRELYPNFDPSFEYLWSPDTYLDDPTIGNPITSAEDDIVYSVTITFPDSSCQVVRQVQVQIFDEPTAEITTQDTVLCELGNITVSATGSGGTFNWYDTDGVLQGEGNPFTLEVRDPNDPYYLLEMIDSNGCVATDSILVANYAIGLEVPADTIICLDELVDLNPILILDSSVDYEATWTPEEPINTNPTELEVTVSPTATTVFTLIVSNEFCSNSADTRVEVIDASNGLSAIADPDTICLSQSTQLDVFGNGSYTNYEWMEPSSATLDFDNVPNPVATPVETTEYMVRVTDENNCEGTAAVRIVVIDPDCGEPFIFFPNAFSPNNDGHNDVLYLRGFNADEVHFVIYNRWGERVYESNRKEDGWDGTYKGERLDSDVFGYYLRVRCTNGEDYVKKGNVTLLR